MKNVQYHARDADELILWLDCDREGENICFEVMQVTKFHLQAKDKDGYHKVYRAKFSGKDL